MMHIVLDSSSLFCTEPIFLWELSRQLMSPSPPKFTLVVDDEGELMREYWRCADIYGEDSPQLQIVELIQENMNIKVFVKTVKPNIEIESVLALIGVSGEVERTTLNLASDSPSRTILFDNTNKIVEGEREFFSIEWQASLMEKIDWQKAYKVTENVHLDRALNFLFLEDFFIDLRCRFDFEPNTFNGLKALLSGFADPSGKLDEKEFLEFKCPENKFLTQSLLESAVIAVCAILNMNDQGWVIIGVDDESGELMPFVPSYKNSKSPSVDLLSRIIYDEIDRITPSPGLLVRAWPILNEAGKCAYVIYIGKSKGTFKYRSKGKYEYVEDIKNGSKTKVYKFGTLNSVRWIRRGNQSVNADTRGI